MIKGCLGTVLHQPARRVKSAKVRDGGKKDGTLVLISVDFVGRHPLTLHNSILIFF